MEERWEPNAREVVEEESRCEIESVVHVDYKDSLAMFQVKVNFNFIYKPES